jgi:hypothetical protein
VLPLEQEPGAIEGKVTDTGGNPVQAEVNLDGKIQMTDVQGEFAFEGLFPGDYTVTASAQGKTASEYVPVYEGQTAPVTVELPITPPKLKVSAPNNATEGDTFAVSVTLEGQPVSGAEVTMGESTVVTEKDGTANMTAPEVEEDETMDISVTSSQADGSTSIDIKTKRGYQGLRQ